MPIKYFLFVLLSASSLSASAQWYHIDLKKHERYPLLYKFKDHSIARIKIDTKVSKPKIFNIILSPSELSLELQEAAVMKIAQHNMRFRIYTVASYNFSDLAQLYIQQNRLSEAKWYFLQSNFLSRQQNDDKHTISNLMGLAMIKALLADFDSSAQDLSEAHDLAKIRGLQTDLVQVDRESKYIKDHRSTFVKTEVRYAEAVENEIKNAQ